MSIECVCTFIESKLGHVFITRNVECGRGEWEGKERRGTKVGLSLGERELDRHSLQQMMLSDVPYTQKLQ